MPHRPMTSKGRAFAPLGESSRHHRGAFLSGTLFSPITILEGELPHVLKIGEIGSAGSSHGIRVET